MSSYKIFTRDLSKIFGANIVTKVIGFLIIIIISRTLTVDEFGDFELLSTFFLLTLDFSDFGTSVSLVDYISKNKSRRYEILSTILIFKILIVLTLGLFVLVLAEEITLFIFNDTSYLNIILLIPLGVFINSILNLLFAFLQSIENFKDLAKYQIIISIIKILLIITLVYFFNEPSLIYLISIIIFTPLAVLVPLIFNNLKVYTFFEKKIILDVYKVGLWIFISSILVMFTIRIDIFMIEKLSDDLNGVGYFALALKINTLFVLFINSISSVILPRINEFIQENSINDYRKMLYKLKWILILVLLIIVISMPILINGFFGEKYNNSILSAQILTISIFFSFYASTLGVLFVNKLKTKYLTFLNFTQLILVVALNFILIPIIGIEGSAISLFLMRLLGYLFIEYKTSIMQYGT
tara:strand:- start:1508 stop:2743 length:1236 start_codon:yes stop_codon:yes gene_type:complete